MKQHASKLVKVLFIVFLLVVLGIAYYVHTKQPIRKGDLAIKGLTAAVDINYDTRGVPHIYAQNIQDLYRALGYVQAQDRLFQIEMLRRVSQGELSAVLGSKTLAVDKFFRTIGIKTIAEKMYRQLKQDNPALLALGNAYLDGVNQYVDTRPSPMEFDLLGIKKHHYTMVDILSIIGYMAYSFDPAFKLIPALSYINEKLGPNYVAPFNVTWPKQFVQTAVNSTPSQTMQRINWDTVKAVVTAQNEIPTIRLPEITGSNAWAVSGRLTQSGKPILAGDPHIDYPQPAIWYEADLHSPTSNLYGYFLPLGLMAMLGHNEKFAWSFTILMNADTNFIALETQPKHPEHVRYHSAWVPLVSHQEQIAVKGELPVDLTVTQSPYGPLINGIMPGHQVAATPIAMRWTFAQQSNPILEALSILNQADTVEKANQAASMIAAPGLNLVWANAKGDIAWWALAKLSFYRENINPYLILDASKGQADKMSFRPFAQNPHDINPARGFVVSANNQPQSAIPIAGSYSVDNRAQEITRQLQKMYSMGQGVTIDDMKRIQLDNHSDFGPDFIQAIMPQLNVVVTNSKQRQLLKLLKEWHGDYKTNSIPAVVFSQLLYEVAHQLMGSVLDDELFSRLSHSHPMLRAMLNIAKDNQSPWWHIDGLVGIPAKQMIVELAWNNTLKHLTQLYGPDYLTWRWARAHELTMKHPLGVVKPLNYLLDVGPYALDGGLTAPNEMGYPISSAPWPVKFGASTRRIIDFGNPNAALGGLPTGESGVPFDRHYRDQADHFITGHYQPMWMSPQDVTRHTESTLRLTPA